MLNILEDSFIDSRKLERKFAMKITPTTAAENQDMRGLTEIALHFFLRSYQVRNLLQNDNLNVQGVTSLLFQGGGLRAMSGTFKDRITPCFTT